MAHITFEFNNMRFEIYKADSEAEKIFETITGIKIDTKITQETKKQIEEIKNEIIIGEKSKEKKHPSVQQLIYLIENQPNLEFGTEVIREKFYPNLDKNEWKKAYSSIYAKIKDAKKQIEVKERGHFVTRKEGKFTYYSFVKDNIPPLSKYEIKVNE